MAGSGVAQTTDGTAISTGTGSNATPDLISSEDMTGVVRLNPDVPQLNATNAGYKIERTKIAIGTYDQDRGDVSNDGGRGFPVEFDRERRLFEYDFLRQSEVANMTLKSRQSERMPTAFFQRSGRDGRI
jgi:hypothetical protein